MPGRSMPLKIPGDRVGCAARKTATIHTMDISLWEWDEALHYAVRAPPARSVVDARARLMAHLAPSKERVPDTIQ